MRSAVHESMEFVAPEWGATDEEARGTMFGDQEVALPGYQTTLGVTINAAPADIWPWLMQMGHRRGGLYSYDWLDRLFGYLEAPSAERILPEWQKLSVADAIPIGRGGGCPVEAIEPYDRWYSRDSRLVSSGAGSWRSCL